MKHVTYIIPVLFILFSMHTMAQEPDLEQYPVKPVYPPQLQRPSVALNKDALPKGFYGQWPEFDGQFFSLNLSGREDLSASGEAARDIINTVLTALNWKEQDKAMQPLDPKNLPQPASKKVEQTVDQAIQKTQDQLKRRYRNLNRETEEMLNDQAQHAREQTTEQTILYRFDELYRGIAIENTFLQVTWRSGKGFSSLNGRVFNDIKVSNQIVLSEDQANVAAKQHLKDCGEAQPGPAGATQVILPYGDGFRYTWKLQLQSDCGVYEIWIDAQDGKVLQLMPMFSSVRTGYGLRFEDNPRGDTVRVEFRVDNAANGVYRLKLNGVLSVTNAGADGVSSGDLTLNDDGSNTANFAVSPYNGIAVDSTGQPGYNSRFQDINAYAWLYSHISTFNDVLGSVTMPDIGVTVNHNNPCGLGIDNACANWGTWTLVFGIGNSTIGNGTSCNEMFNSALDATILTHEFGHLVNHRNIGGTVPGHMDEGLADFWGYTSFNTDTVGAYWGSNCANNSQGGWIPRQVEGLDVFPEHQNLNNGDYGNGQIIGWALWNVRRELNEVSALGTYLINSELLDAFATVAFTNNVAAQIIHNNFLALEQQLGQEFISSTNIHKVLSGFARAGIFLAPADAVIDINDDYLDRQDVNGPVFTVWTGRDYIFNANGTVNTANQPFNTRYTVEVANDVNFTQNLVSSGVQSGVVAADGGRATWQLPQADWTTLRAANRLYYRLTTTDATGGNVRTSGNPGSNFFQNVPVPYAVINDSGDCECACGASAAAPKSAVAVTLMPVLLGLWWMRRLKRQPASSTHKNR